jgi:hypothetical protein
MLNVYRRFRLLRSCGPTDASLAEENWYCYKGSIFWMARHAGAIWKLSFCDQ